MLANIQLSRLEGGLATLPAAPPAVLIDAHCFPHIIDMIIDAAPHALLLSFRRTNRRLRARADAILARRKCPGGGSTHRPPMFRHLPKGSGKEGQCPCCSVAMHYSAA
jgi:hypothetical protein